MPTGKTQFLYSQQHVDLDLPSDFNEMSQNVPRGEYLPLQTAFQVPRLWKDNLLGYYHPWSENILPTASLHRSVVDFCCFSGMLFLSLASHIQV